MCKSKTFPLVKQVGYGALLMCWSVQVYADISGTVFRDFNANGLFDTGAAFNEVGIAGITVKAFAADAASSSPSASALSGADGSYALNGLAVGQPYRLEFSWSAAWLKPGAAGGTSVQFALDGATGIHFAVGDPNDYWDNTQVPRYVVPQYWNGLASANSSSTGVGSTLYTSTGLNSNYQDYDGIAGTGPIPREDLTVSQVGSVWGEAYHKTQKHLYLTTFLKRHVGMADGTGYIYNVDYSGATPALAGKFDLQGVVPSNGGSAIDLGTVTRTGSADFTLPDDKYTPSWDIDAFGKVATVSYGDADIQPGTDYLWTVNLFQKALIRVDVSGNPGSVPADVKQYVLSDLPGYPTSATGVLRPWGLAFAYGKGYLGVVDDASISALQPDLKAIVLEFDPTNILGGFTQKVNFHPNVKRQNTDSWDPFFPWINAYAEPPVFATGAYRYKPQPVLSDLEFDENGNMYLSFFDRWGHQMGYWNYRPLSGNTTTVRPSVYGEILKACSTASGWEIEGTGACHVGSTEFIQDISGDEEVESSEGAIAVLKGTNQLLQVSIDPHPQGLTSSTYWTTQGTNTYSLSNGQISHWYSFYQNSNVEAYGKANGLGDVELLLPPAPIEVGNRVWLDADSDGIQDAGEAGIDGLQVKLVCGADEAVAITADGGVFLFSNASGGNAEFMGAGENCSLHVVNTQVVLDGYVLTTINADGIGSNDALTDLRDSDATRNGGTDDILFTVGNSGDNNHSLDMGYKSVPLTDISLAKNLDKPSAKRGEVVVYTLTASNGSTTPATGVEVADPLPAGVTYLSDDGVALYGTDVFDETSGLWTVGSVPPGGDKVLHLTVRIN